MNTSEEKGDAVREGATGDVKVCWWHFASKAGSLRFVVVLFTFLDFSLNSSQQPVGGRGSLGSQPLKDASLKDSTSFNGPTVNVPLSGLKRVNRNLYFPFYYTFASWYVCAQSLRRVRLCATPWTVARQAPLSVGFSRQEDWPGQPCRLPGDCPNPLPGARTQVSCTAGSS